MLVRAGTEREEVNEEGHPNDVFQWSPRRVPLARRPRAHEAADTIDRR